MQGPFATDIKAMMEAWIGALSAVAIDAGCDKRRARGRAERFIALLEGSLVVSRGLGTVQPFRDVLKGAALELLGDQRSSRDS
jgi:predicted YcjX-like family ATPase